MGGIFENKITNELVNLSSPVQIHRKWKEENDFETRGIFF